MKLFFNYFFVLTIAVSIGFLAGCQKKEAEENRQRPSVVETPEIPSPDTPPPAPVKPAPERKKKTENKPTPGINREPDNKRQQTVSTEKAGSVPKIAVTFHFNTHGVEIPVPIKVKYEDKILGKTRVEQLNLKLKEDYLDKNLIIEAPYFKPLPPVTVTENTTEFNIDLQPLLVKIEVSDSMGIYSREVNNVQIFLNDKLLGKTNNQGLAEVRLPHIGANNLIFFKPHFFIKQSHVLKVNGNNAVVKVALLPLKHFIRIKLLNENNRPLANREVELAGSGLALNERTNNKGLVTLKSFSLKPGTKYQLHIRSVDYTDNEFSFTEAYFDTYKKYISVKIPVRYNWSIRTNTEDAQIALFDFSGRKIAEGTGRLDVKISRGTYKIVAKSGSTVKEELIDAARSPHSKVVIMDECYSYAQEWNKQHPGNSNLPDEIINCLNDIPTSDPNFINSRMLLAKTFMKNKKYGNAKIYYEDILRYDRSKKYDPVMLYNTAQAIIFFSDNIKNGQNKLQLLEQASSNYLDNASAYITKLPIRSRKKWIIKIEYLRGELYQRLFFYYKKIDSYELARQNGNAALDAFNSFIRDYNSLSPSSSLKQLLKKDYERAVDLTGSIKAAQTM